MPFIRIQVTGLNESIRGINNFIRNIPNTNKAILEESTDLFERVAKEKVHVITGKTKRSTRKLGVFKNYGVVESRFGAKWEEKREGSKGSLGPHKFLTEAARVTKEEMPDIIKRHYDNLINRSRSV